MSPRETSRTSRYLSSTRSQMSRLNVGSLTHCSLEDAMSNLLGSSLRQAFSLEMLLLSTRRLAIRGSPKYLNGSNYNFQQGRSLSDRWAMVLSHSPTPLYDFSTACDCPREKTPSATFHQNRHSRSPCEELSLSGGIFFHDRTFSPWFRNGSLDDHA